jgi:hypothetical protein
MKRLAMLKSSIHQAIAKIVELGMASHKLVVNWK